MTTERKQWVSWEEFDALFPGLTPYSVINYSRIGGLIPGSIPFGNASGLLDEDNANLFWDETNVRLGIGTATPDVALDIEFPAVVSVVSRVSAKTRPWRHWECIDGDWGLAIGIYDDDDIIHFNYDSPIGTRDTTMMVFDGANTRVGILDVAPAYPFDVGGNTNIQGTFRTTGAVTLLGTLGVAGATTLSSTLAVTGLLSNTGGAKLEIQGEVDGTSARGIFMWDSANTNWGIYVSESGAGKSLADGVACTNFAGDTGHHFRFRIVDLAARAFIWENSSEACLMDLEADTGNVGILGILDVRSGNIISNSGAISFGNENLSTTGTLSATGITDTGVTATNMAAGTTGERPGGIVGDIRYNSTLGEFELYIAAWHNLARSGANITFGTIGCGTITIADGSSLLLQEDITFGGATTENQIIFPDNLADALSFLEGANPYMTFVSTNGSEAVKFEKDVIVLGSLITDHDKQNLITNSGFGVCSLSVLTDIIAQIDVTDITAGVCTTVDTQSLQVGDLVKFNGGGTTLTNIYEVIAVVADTSFTIHDITITDATDVTCDEATPAFIAADVYAPDSWTKTSTLDLYRWFNHSTYHKGMYGLQVTKGADGAEYLNAFGSIASKDHHYLRFRGRTVTLGCWVYSVTVADNVKVQINDSDGTTESSFVAADTLTWVEITRTCGATITSLTPRILFDGDTADVAYVSKPMLVFGSSIGSGNYHPIQQEIIWYEKFTSFSTLNGWVGSTTGAFIGLNLEAEVNGTAPKGCKAIYLLFKVQDSGSAGANCYFRTRADSTVILGFFADCSGLANDRTKYNAGWCMCDVNGDFEYDVSASGANTFTIGSAHVLAVQLY